MPTVELNLSIRCEIVSIDQIEFDYTRLQFYLFGSFLNQKWYFVLRSWAL
ncbi:hypothetical protein Cha6605_5407 [Chamaesiphon minutus PCC 6605]|uniref:Uncharacterized protein n=1 Tax=Chamaesiphon minutus (strain ATCC 27169 / PCC 6605) TaxID=1173020 RepID=K9UQ18_CHAP6|nr:hypothetical protein Cha6605_5407 [Chamaesiphon minutus PCC 6605]